MTDYEAYVANIMHQRGLTTEVVAKALGFIGTDETIPGCETEPETETEPALTESKRPRPINDAERREIRAMLRDGVPVKIIAQRMGRAQTTIYRIEKRLSA